MVVVAQGRRGTISVHEENGQRIAHKAPNAPMHQAALVKERDILLFLNSHDIPFVPHLVSHDETSFHYKWIDGVPLRTQWDHLSVDQKRVVANRLIDHAYSLDTVGVVHGELDRPSTNVLIDPSLDIFIVDFDRGRLGDTSGTNLRHLAQRLKNQGWFSLAEIKSLKGMEREAIYEFLKRKDLTPQVNNHVNTKLRIHLLIGFILLSIDQGTKWAFVTQKRGEDLWILTPAFNTGIGRSLPIPFAGIIAGTVIVLGMLTTRYYRDTTHRLALLLLMIGAIGNLIDRLLLGGVRDFIDLHVRPIFNVADMCITAGVLLLFRKEIKPSS